MPLLFHTAQSGSGDESCRADCVTIGLINNMPDAALAATERQFAELIRAGARDTDVRLMLFSIAEVPRGETARQAMAARYRDVGELWNTTLDGLIVTGTEPKSKNLKDEPYWARLAQIIGWARESTASTIWSCLAAHAAVLACDGIERRPFAEKLSGVFDCVPAQAHPIMRSVPLPMRIPHSRCNDLPERALAAAGYRILTRSRAAGVDMFARQDRGFHLFMQGHPEYEAGTLLREYRRDVGRYLRGKRRDYPAMPRGYFDEKATAVLDAFRARAREDRRSELFASFPAPRIEAGLSGSWRSSAIALYGTWLEYLKGRKAERRSTLVPRRRAWRDWPPRGAPEAGDSPAA
ncbi:MAG: homoserine O-succinyltransferase [Xanthobacteraceae bacterium]